MEIITTTRSCLSQTGPGCWLYFWAQDAETMAPKARQGGRGVAARAKAQAAVAARRRKNAKRDARRAALLQLNGLAEEVGAAAAQVDPRSAAAADVERAIHVLEQRCQQPALAARLRTAVQAWVERQPLAGRAGAAA